MTSETTRINATIDGQPITALVNFKDGQFHSLQIDRNEADLQLDWFNPKGFADYLALMACVEGVVKGKKAANEKYVLMAGPSLEDRIEELDQRLTDLAIRVEEADRDRMEGNLELNRAMGKKLF